LRRVSPGDRIQTQESVTLEGATESVTFKPIRKPAWAAAIEQGPDGLYCTLPGGGRVRWCYPGEELEGLGGRFHPLATAPGSERAAWVSIDQLKDFGRALRRPYLPDDSDGKTISIDGGADQYGHYAELRVGRQTFRLRWIPPGEFQMGSPEDEPERDDNEARHRVILTRGLWLAETACTQGLWREVMGQDRSRFKGEDLPVERVSWEDVQAFCERLNERLPGLAARLPSEAEWEYACRAGTQGPFWWGEELSTELANYDGNYPYDDAPKGERRGKTLPVRHFNPNPWGLYQVHGNVWEWCEDWYGEYPTDDTVDPTGPERGSLRVIRGGCWLYYGGRLRAAFRFHALPAVRNSFLGFRLAAGPRPGGAGEPGGGEDTAAVGSGSGRRGRGSGHSGRE
jgi:formylglycine-generating enzyme required for sulfatase activity